MEFQSDKIIELLGSTKGQATDNYRSDDRFEKIKDIFDSSNDPNATNSSINWQKISDLSTMMVADGAKDILITNYLCIAQLKTAGIKGLAQGLSILDAIVSEHWQEMYPPIKRITGRWAAIEWLITELSTYLEGQHGQLNSTDIEIVIEHLNNIDKSITSVSQDPPNLLPTIKRFERLLQHNTLIEEEGATQSVEEQSSQMAISTQPVSSISSIDEALTKTTEIFESLDVISDYLLQNSQDDDSKSVGYKLSLFSIFGKINTLPPYGDDYKTKVPSPDTEQQNQLDLLVKSANYDALLELSQSWVKDNPFWFDLHRDVYTALVAKSEQKIADIFKANCLSFVTKYPDIQKMKFVDESAMLSNDTYSWLVEGLSNNNSTQTTIASMPTDEFMNEVNKAQTLPVAQRIDALMAVYDKYQSSVSRYKKIEFYLHFAQELVSEQRTDLLSIYTDLLEEEFYYFNISELDKKMAVAILQIIIKAKKILNRDFYKNYKDLSKLDLSATVGISTGN